MGEGLRFWLYGSAPGGAETRRAGRDWRIDSARGLALLIIFINHMPGNFVSAWMPHNFGFSDAADIFVVLAGLSATLAYGGVLLKKGLLTGSARLGARIVRIYLAHLVTFAIVCGVVALAVTQTDNPLYLESINILPIFADTRAALVGALGLTFQPSYLDILPLYIVLLALFPLLYRLVCFSPALALALSLAVWQIAVAAGWNFPARSGAGWFFNPFAWQVIFTLGIVIGRMKQLGVALPASRMLDVLALGVLGFALAAKLATGNPFAFLGIAALTDWVDMLQLGIDKTNLAVVRVLHVLAIVWLATRMLAGGAEPAFGSLGRTLAMLGRHSLPVFCAGTVLAVGGQIVLAETAFEPRIQLLVCACGITLLIGLGKFLSWTQSLAYRSKAAGASLRGPSASLSS